MPADDTGLRPPIDPALGALLRRAVQDHAGLDRARRPEPHLHVGTPGARVARVPVGPAGELDAGLCVDVVAAMRARVRTVPYVANRPELHTPLHDAEPALVWVTRAGDLAEVQDVDLRWLAAARSAYDEAAVPLCFVVLNRHGWRDPRSGLARTWVRLRRPVTPVAPAGSQL